MNVGDLAAIPLFASLEVTVLEDLVARSRVEILQPGTIAARQGARADRLIVVHSGALEAVCDTPAGARVRLGIFAAPCAVDKVALLDVGTHTATWEAVELTRLRKLERRDVLALVEDVPSVRRHVLGHLAAQARRHQSARILATTATATTRAACWLAEQMALSGTLVTLPVGGQQGLAETIGASRVTTNRALQHLARSGVIRIEADGRIRILSPEILTATIAGT